MRSSGWKKSWKCLQNELLQSNAIARPVAATSYQRSSLETASITSTLAIKSSKSCFLSTVCSSRGCSRLTSSSRNLQPIRKHRSAMLCKSGKSKLRQLREKKRCCRLSKNITRLICTQIVILQATIVASNC